MKRVKVNHKNTVNYTVLSLFGLTCLLIYLFYRPQDIMINQYLFSTFPELILIKTTVIQRLPLNDFLVYNLPAGLWVFSLTVLLKDVHLNSLFSRFSLHTIPLGLGLLIELFQFLKLTDGTFDLLDVYTMLGFFLIAQLLCFSSRQLRMESDNIQQVLVSIGLLILFLGNSWL